MRLHRPARSRAGNRTSLHPFHPGVPWMYLAVSHGGAPHTQAHRRDTKR